MALSPEWTAFWGDHWGDVASLGGLVVSVVGFGFTIYGVSQSKSAAEKAQEAAASTLERVRGANCVTLLTSILEIIAEIKRLQRSERWEVVVDRYATLRKLAIDVAPLLDANDVSSAEARADSYAKMAKLEEQIEKFIHKEPESPNVPLLNKRLQEIESEFAAALGKLKYLTGETHDIRRV